MSRPECDRLNRELAILRDGELKFKLPAAPISRQLVTDAERPLPDVLPKPLVWTTFEWPGEIVDLNAYWRAVDRKGKVD